MNHAFLDWQVIAPLAILWTMAVVIIGYFVGVSHGAEDGYLDGLEQQQAKVDELSSRLADMTLRRDHWRSQAVPHNQLSTLSQKPEVTRMHRAGESPVSTDNGEPRARTAAPLLNY